MAAGTAGPGGHGGPAAQPGDGRARRRSAARSPRRSAQGLRHVRGQLLRVQGDYLAELRSGREPAGRSRPSRARATSCPTRSRPGTASSRRRARLFARYGYREIRTPVFEETAAVRARHRRRDRHRLEGDVHLRRPRRPLPDPAARGHGRHRARGHRAQPDEHRPRAEGLRAGPDVPPRAAAEGALPAVPPGGRRGVRHGAPVDRRRGHRDGAGVPVAPAASPGYELVLNSVGDAELPARLRGDAARRRCAPNASRLCADCQRRTETNPLRVLDCKVPAGPGRSSRRCRASPTTCAPSAATTSRRCGASCDAARASRTA